jgi:hypothetical protein
LKRLLVIVWLLLAPAPAAANLRPLFTNSANALGGEVEPETDYRGWVGGGLLVLAVLAIGWLARRRATPKELEEQPGAGGEGVGRKGDDQGVR